jgi:hypothetical protein
MTIVSFSELNTWQRCRKSYYYNYTLGFIPIEESPALRRGKMGHRMMQTYLESRLAGVSHEEAKRTITKDLTREETEDPIIIKTWGLVCKHVDTLDFSNVESVYIEQVFKHPLVEAFDLWVGFTPDYGWLFKGGFLTLEDFKFIEKMWSEKKKSRYVQLDLYAGWMREMGENVSQSILRFFNLTTGEITSKPYTPSSEKFKILRREFTLAAIELQEFKSKTVAEQRELAFRTFDNNTCAFCRYSYPCNLEANGKDASKTFLAEFTTNDYGYEQ